MGQIERAGSENLTGGEVTSLPPHLIGTGEAQSSDNLDPRDLRGAVTRKGRATFGVTNGSGSVIKGLRSWVRNAGTQYLIGRIGTTFYDISAAAWVSIGIGGTDGERFRADPLLNSLCIVVDGLAPKKYDGATFASLAGSPPSEAKHAAVHMSKLFLSGDDANPQKVSFCATNNPDDWTAANDAGSITTASGGGDVIKGLVSTRKVLCIFYRHRTDILIGDSVFNFRIERLIDRGLVSESGYASAGEVAFFASDDAIYMVAGSKVSDLTTLKFRETYKEIADKTKVSLAIKGDLLIVSDYSAGTTYACAYRYNRWATWSGQGWNSIDTGTDDTIYAAPNGSTTRVFNLDTGTLDGTATVTSKWRTPDLSFGWPDATKNLTNIRGHVKPGMPTMTLVYYKNGVDTGASTTIDKASIATAGAHEWVGRHGQRALRGQFIAVEFRWTGQATLYGWALYAEITTPRGDIPVEV